MDDRSKKLRKLLSALQIAQERYHNIGSSDLGINIYATTQLQILQKVTIPTILVNLCRRVHCMPSGGHHPVSFDTFKPLLIAIISDLDASRAFNIVCDDNNSAGHVDQLLLDLACHIEEYVTITLQLENNR